jgi:hypothetical protein
LIKFNPRHPDETGTLGDQKRTLLLKDPIPCELGVGTPKGFE